MRFVLVKFYRENIKLNKLSFSLLYYEDKNKLINLVRKVAFGVIATNITMFGSKLT